MATKVTVDSIASDGANLYFEIRITDGARTFPYVRPVFPVGTSAAEIRTYIQNIANTAPVLTGDIEALAGVTVTGV